MTRKIGQQGFIRYTSVGTDYLQRRQLRRGANWILLWALGVGAVISGEFSGWNAGLTAGGFGGLAIATVLMALMYVCMVFSIAELSAALPHAGGFYAFTRNAFGPVGGFICGASDTIEYVLTPAVIVFFIGGYLNTLLPFVPVFVWWLVFYASFLVINSQGVELTLKAGLVITAIATLVLVIFFLGALVTGAFKVDLLLNIPPQAGQSVWLPKGWPGVFQALPYAIWFYLAIEQIPLAAEEAHDAVRDVPKALLWGISSLLILSLLVLVLNSGVNGGAAAIGTSSAPLAEGFKAVFGDGPLTKILTLVALTGLVASFHTVMFAYGRVLFSLSRAGYFPQWLSITNKHKSPARSLIFGGLVGLVALMVIQFAQTGGEQGKIVGAALLNMAVFGAVISYAMVMVSYIKLKLARPDLPRPYLSPLGIPGAAIGTVLALTALVACFADPGYQPGVLGVAIALLIGIIYFLLHSRTQLVAEAPEERDALH